MWMPRGPAAPSKVTEILRAEINNEESEEESEENRESANRNHWDIDEINFDD